VILALVIALHIIAGAIGFAVGYGLFRLLVG
jgi:hypothetical protein